MKTFKSLTESLRESLQFTNWVRPDTEALKLEYKVEYQIKSLKELTNDAWPTFADFKRSVDRGRVVSVNSEFDRNIAYRSRTRNKQALLSLIRTYASYPKFRNEETIEAIYRGFEENKPMKMPIVLRFPNGDMRVMGGNTRMDVAFHMGLKPKVLLVDVPEV